MAIVETGSENPAVNVYPNGNSGSGFGDVFGGMGGGAIFFWLILFFFMMMFMGWGNNGNAAGNGSVQYVPYGGPMMYGGGYGGEIRQGFDQAAIVNGINGLQTTMLTGFNNAEVSRCNQQANVLAAMNNQAMALQNCCCENRANIADVKYAIANEACADRAAVTDALYNLTAQNNANMNMMMNTINAGIQTLKDDNCKMLMDQKDARIAELERQLTIADIKGGVIANNEAQTTALEQYLAPTPRPAYIVQNPNCCNQNFGCRSCG